MGVIEDPGSDGTPSQLRRVDAACDAFETAWRSGGRPRIESYLGATTPHQRNGLVRELMALELELRRAAGDRPDCNEYRARFPDLSEGELDSAFDSSAEQDAPAAGRYRVLRPLSRGGLGEVSLAYDGVLRREVALKEILPGQAGDADRRARFVQEARVTGAFEHPGIVPVHDAGRRDDGRPYYVMRLLGESSLKEAIAKYHRHGDTGADPGPRSVAFRGLVRRVVDVCNAIGYAHSRGVIHRDLKPANIMLGSFGETLVVDWGLARFYERPDASEEGTTSNDPDDNFEATRTGGPGTPRYMSPEQARGDRSLGPPCDVYGLGAILYSVISGRAPFEGGDTASVLERVRLGAIAPPRQVNPDVPPALAAVCLKAMALRPEDRYATARTLADDLEHWLAGAPVSAWREPLVQRVGRWIGRHRTAVAVGGVAIAGLAAILVQAGWNRIASQERVNQLLTARLKEKDEDNRVLAAAQLSEEQARERAQSRFALALEAVHTNDAYLTGERLFNEPRFRVIRRKLLGSALDFDRRLEENLKTETDPEALELLTRAYAKTARLYCGVGDKSDGLEAFKRYAAAAERLAQARPNEPRFGLELAHAYNELGRILFALDDRLEAMAIFERCRQVLESLVRLDPVPENRRDLFKAYLNIGILRSNLKETATAFTAFAAAREVIESLVRSPGEPCDRVGLTNYYLHIGLLDGTNGRPKQGLDAIAHAREILQDLVKTDPNNASYRILLAFSEMHSGILQEQEGRVADALASHLRAQAIRDRLLRENLADSSVRFDLSRTCAAIAELHRKAGDLDGALREYTSSLALAERFVHEDPDLNWHHSWLGEIHRKHIGLLRLMGRPVDAGRHALAAVRAYEAHPKPGSDDWYNLACAHAQVTDSDATATSKSVSAFAQAIAAGYRNANEARNDPDLEPVRTDPLFRTLLMDLDFPANPFAR